MQSLKRFPADDTEFMAPPCRVFFAGRPSAPPLPCCFLLAGDSIRRAGTGVRVPSVHHLNVLPRRQLRRLLLLLLPLLPTGCTSSSCVSCRPHPTSCLLRLDLQQQTITLLQKPRGTELLSYQLTARARCFKWSL